MNDLDLSNYIKTAKELLTRNLHQNMNTSQELKNTLIHKSILKNATKDQKQKLNSSIEDLSKHYDKSMTKMQSQSVFDREYLVQENDRLKKIINKKNLQLDELRFSNLKMDERNEKNLKNFEEIIAHTKNFAKSNHNFKKSSLTVKTNTTTEMRNDTSPNRQETKPLEKSTNFDEIENTKEIETEPNNNGFKPEILDYGVKKLKEISLINGLRRQILDFKCQIRKKDEEIEKMKESLKCVRLSELDNNYKKQSDEFGLLKNEVEILTNTLNENNARMKTLQEENHNAKSQLNLFKARYDDAMITLNKLQNENKELKEKTKDLGEKTKNLDYRVYFTKKIVKDKEKEIDSYKQEKEMLESLKLLKNTQDIKVQDLNNKCTTFRMDNKLKSDKIAELEKKITQMQDDMVKSQNSLNKKIKQHEETMKGYKDEKENFNKKMEELKKSHEKALEEVNNEVKQLKESLEAEEAKSSSIIDKLSDQEKENSKLKKEIVEITKTLKEAETEKDRLQKELDQHRKDKETEAKTEGNTTKEETK